MDVQNIKACHLKQGNNGLHRMLIVLKLKKKKKEKYLHRNCPLRIPFTPWSSRASKTHFMCTEKFTLDLCRIRITDLSLDLQANVLPLEQKSPLQI